MNLLAKAVSVPHLLFGVSFQKGKQPYQDFRLLVRIRNDIVHYKMKFERPEYLRNFNSGNTITAKDEMADYPWAMRLSSTEGIRWAHNTACKVVQKLATFVPDHLLKTG